METWQDSQALYVVVTRVRLDAVYPRVNVLPCDSSFTTAAIAFYK